MVQSSNSLLLEKYKDKIINGKELADAIKGEIKAKIL